MSRLRTRTSIGLGSALLSLLVLLVGGVPSAAAWESPNGSPTPVYGITPFGDPGAAGYGAGGAGVEFFGTTSPKYMIPTETWSPVGTSSISGSSDSLSSAVPGVSFYAAPTVATIQGQYVMWFVGYQQKGTAAQLYFADSPTVNGPYHVRGRYYNSGNPSFGLFDPTLYQDTSGNWWLLWAIENGPTNSNNAMVSAQLTANGEGFAGGSNGLFNYSYINGGMEANNSGIQPGANAQIENPDLITDPQGTWATNMTFPTAPTTRPVRTGPAILRVTASLDPVATTRPRCRTSTTRFAVRPTWRIPVGPRSYKAAHSGPKRLCPSRQHPTATTLRDRGVSTLMPRTPVYLRRTSRSMPDL